jgi:hypothetical protein
MSFILLGILNSQAVAAGGGSDFELISTSLISSNTTDVYFESIPQTYKHLQVRMTVRNSATFSTAIRVRPNYDSGVGNYTTHRLRGYGSGQLSNFTDDTGRLDHTVLASNNTANIYGVCILDILDYTNSNKYKTMRAVHGYCDQASGGNNIVQTSMLWMNTSAMTDLQLNCWDGSFVSGSRFSLYGIKG